MFSANFVLDNLTVAEKCSRRCLIGEARLQAIDTQECPACRGDLMTNTNAAAAAAPRLLDQVRAKIRLRHYSLRTEEAYTGWVKRFVLFHGKRHPREMGARKSRRS